MEATPGGGNGIWEVVFEPHYKRSAGTPEAKAPRHGEIFLSGLMVFVGVGGGFAWWGEWCLGGFY